MDGGAKKLLRLRMIKDAYIGDIFWYPPDTEAELPNGQTMLWRDLAREIIDCPLQRRHDDAAAVCSTRTATGCSTTHRRNRQAE